MCFVLFTALGSGLRSQGEDDRRTWKRVGESLPVPTQLILPLGRINLVLDAENEPFIPSAKVEQDVYRAFAGTKLPVHLFDNESPLAASLAGSQHRTPEGNRETIGESVPAFRVQQPPEHVTVDALDPQNARDREEKVWSTPDLIEDGVKAGQPVPGR